MSWSTSELARLAGTTVNTVRHYHALGLLDEPERRYNGYKLYGVRHLVCLLRLRRIASLGVPLAQVREASRGGRADFLRIVDRELRAEISRLEHSRTDIRAILGSGSPVDTPHGFEAVGGKLRESDTSFLHVCARLCPPAALPRLQELVAAEPTDVREQFHALQADASESARARVATRVIRSGVHWRSTRWLPLTAAHETLRVLGQTVSELYNAAQYEVLGRADSAI